MPIWIVSWAEQVAVDGPQFAVEALKVANVTDSFAHTDVFPMTVIGELETVTSTVSKEVTSETSVTVSRYVVLVEGKAFGFSAVALLNPVEGLHW